VPKQVDHEERRREIASAVVRLVTSKGVEAASLRAVAAEAGVSMGAVQHYFTTKDQMLLFALEYGNGILGTRIQELLAERQPATLRESIRLIGALLLPLDADSRTGARLWAGLISRGSVDEPTRKLAEDAYANLTAFVARGLADAASAGEIAMSTDLMQSARLLVSVIDGLRWPLLFGTYTHDEALAALDACIDQIFGSTSPR
jgi:TetR/AcrR family transcriptional regulator, transcriptional repressor of bet genes